MGDRAHRGELIPRVQDLGYAVSPVRERELLLRVAQTPGPGAVIVCLGGTDASGLVRSLRESPAGTAIPVLLYGRLEGETRDLAEVLELGADRFLEAPVDEEELRAALTELAGPPEVESRAEPRPEPRPELRNDPILSRLHRTLAGLAARLETREESGDSHRDGIDLEAMGLDAVPDVDPEHDSGELELLREPTQRLKSGPREAETPRPGRWGARRELTFSREGEISPTTSAGEAPEAAVSERTSPVITAAREDVRKQRSARWGESHSGERSFAPTRAVTTELPAATPWPNRPAGAQTVEPTTRLRREPVAARTPVAAPETRDEDEMDAPALLAMLRGERFTGCVQVAERRLWWSEGQVVGGASAAASESVLGRLMARGLLGAAHLELAARWNTGDARRDVERLAQAGLLKPQEMREALREPVRRLVEKIAEAGQVAWTRYPGETPAVAVELGVPLAALIAEGVQRGTPLSQLRTTVIDARRPRLAFAGPEALAAELRWPIVAAIAGRFDGKTSVGELIAEAVAEEAVVRGAVYVLDLLGHLAPEIDDPAATLAALDRQRVRERLRLARESDYFALLGLPREASRAEVLRAHADLSATFCEGLEPDSQVALADEVEALLAALDEARDVLADDALHSAYLAQIGAV